MLLSAWVYRTGVCDQIDPLRVWSMVCDSAVCTSKQSMGLRLTPGSDPACGTKSNFLNSYAPISLSSSKAVPSPYGG